MIIYWIKTIPQWNEVASVTDYSQTLACDKTCFLKGQCHEIFCFWFFSWISFPQAPEYTIRAVSNFLENSRRYSQLKVDQVNLKAKMYICVNSTIQRCPNKNIKIFLIEDFSHLPPVSTTPVVNLELRIFPRIFEKIRNGFNGILWGWGETDWWKKTEAKNLVTLSL
jgi:hypothetical protein